LGVKVLDLNTEGFSIAEPAKPAGEPFSEQRGRPSCQCGLKSAIRGRTTPQMLRHRGDDKLLGSAMVDPNQKRRPARRPEDQYKSYRIKWVGVHVSEGGSICTRAF
jgi:hypothetical protein